MRDNLRVNQRKIFKLDELLTSSTFFFQRIFKSLYAKNNKSKRKFPLSLRLTRYATRQERKKEVQFIFHKRKRRKEEKEGDVCR